MREVPEGQLDGLSRNKNGVPGFPGTPFDSVLGRAPEPAKKAGLALRSSVCFRVLLKKVERGRFFSGELGGFRNLLHGSGSGHFRQQLNAAVVLEPRAGGDEAAHNDVFLGAWV